MDAALPPPYRVDQTSQARDDLRRLAQRAKSARIGLAYLHALRDVLARLESAPSHWGDPEHRTKQAGGVVYRGLRTPLLIQYVVYEAEKIVIVLSVRPVPGTALDDAGDGNSASQ